MIDVIEIDAASYTGVENIREIIDHAKFTPTQGRYKVYIIDEVHMLSKNAFNALLKTLEEPPAHTIFLLATTEIHKVPDTVLSRVIRFDLTKIGEKDMYELLVKICHQEHITFEENALRMIITRARGSIRDSLTLMEKCIIEKTVTEKNVVWALHLVNSGFLRETFDACVNGDAWGIMHIIETLENEGIDVREFSTQMTEWIVDHIAEAFQKKSFPLYRELFDLFTRVFVQSRQVSVPMDILRMALYERIQHGKLEQKTITPEIDSNQEISTEIEEKELLPIPSHELNTGTHVLDEPEHELPPPTHEIAQNNHTDEKISEFSPENFLKKIQEMWIKSTMIPLLKTANIELIENVMTITTTAFCQSKCLENTIYQVLENAAHFFHADTLHILSSDAPVQTESTEDIARSIFND
jgi:DNA polymerase III subunit gamma/tau